MLGDLTIPSISLGIGLSIILKAGVELLRWLWETVAQWSEHLQLKQEVHFQLAYTWMKDQWCSSTVRLLSTQT